MEVDQTIQQVEQLYRSITGHDIPPPGRSTQATIPPEQDPGKYVEEQLQRLMGLLGEVTGTSTGSTASTGESPSAWVPEIDTWETETEHVLWVDLPGVKREDVQVQVQADRLVVRGERKPMPNREGEAPAARWTESRMGPFMRVLDLPRDILGDQTTAELKDGVLVLHLPKAQEGAGTRTVPVS
jgi:HSP20 family protein